MHALVLVQSVLNAMASQFNTKGAEVDCSTFNASRICKVLGTVARKGDELLGVEGIEDRPHRQSWFIKPNGPLGIVSVEQLAALVASSKPESAKPASDASGKPSDTVERARRYLAKMDPSIEGEKGSTKLIKAAVALVRGFDLSQNDALQLLQNEFNHRCSPVWTEQELRHKVEDADKGGGERGYLLNDRCDVVDLSEFEIPGGLPAGKQVDEPEKPWGDPKALPDPLPSVMAYSSDLLPESIGAAVDDIAERMQCPPDFPAAAMLVALAALVGCRIGIRPRRYDDWLVVPNLWGAVVGRPSLKKSPAIATAETRIRAIEARERERLAPDILSSDVDAMLSEAKIKSLKVDIGKAIKADNEPEARRLAESIREIEEDCPPIPRRIITTDPTIEKLCDMLNEHRFGMLLWVDELVGWMRSLDREDKAGVRQQFLTLWNGQGRLNIDRIGRGETAVDSPCVGLFGCCTPGGLSDYVSAAMAGGRGDDGLMQRLQVAVWPDSPKEYRHVDRWPDSPARKKLAEVFEMLADLEPIEFASVDEFDDGGIPWLRFDPAGQVVFDRWDSALQRRLRSDDLPEALESHLSKYASMVPSIALVLHLASGDHGPVSGEAASLAVRWADYLETHANRVYSIATAPERQAALPLLRRLIDWPIGKPIRVRSIRENGWAFMSDTDSIEGTLDLLIEGGWVRAIENKPVTGRPTTDFVLHPEAEKFLKSVREGTPKTIETPSKGTFDGFEGSKSKESEIISAPMILAADVVIEPPARVRGFV